MAVLGFKEQPVAPRAVAGAVVLRAGGGCVFGERGGERVFSFQFSVFIILTFLKFLFVLFVLFVVEHLRISLTSCFENWV